MNRIISIEHLSANVVKLRIEAPRIAKKRKAGHFVIVKIDKKGERIPLTISSADPEEGTITLVVQKVGVTSHKITNLKVGDSLTDVVGPLGAATHVKKFGTVLCAGGGVGAAPLLPIVEALHEAGNRVLTVLAARSKELIILEEEIGKFSDEVVIMTDDGSYGRQGLVTHGMEAIIQREKVDFAVTIGPAIMMKFSSMLTGKYNIPTVASLNAIMVDGTGMCGGCRVSIDGKTKFACVDGPDFDGHAVDWQELFSRRRSYFNDEIRSLCDWEGKTFP